MTLVIDRMVGGRALAVLLAAALCWPWPALGQGAPAAQSAVPTDQPLGPQELEQIVAPVALYPDPLLAQVFMASTYPLEVVEASRWERQNQSLKGAQLDEALKKQTWDDSVKSLVSFPPVLTMMNDKLDWTQKLGDAFLGQQKDAMDAVQRLRAKAQAEGNLKSSTEQTVSTEPAPAPPPSPAAQPAAPAPATTQTTVIKIEPANPQVVYVPTYNPTVVYGAWPYPAYPPYYYYPPGYAAATFATAAISFGVGMAVGSALWGGCNWGRGDVNVNVNHYNSFTQNVNTANLQNRVTNTNANRSSGNASTWSHNPDNRRGTQYRDSASQQRYGKGNPAGADSREAFRGRAAEGRQELQRGAADQFRQGAPGDRPGQGQGAGGGSVGDRAGQGPAGGGSAGDRAGQAQRQGSGGLSDRSGAGGGTGQARGGGAFQGVGSGSQARDFGNRGQASISQARGGAAGGVQRGGGGGGSRGGGRRR
jgi:hypothetical protein